MNSLEAKRRFAFGAGMKLYRDYLAAETPEETMALCECWQDDFRRRYKDNAIDLDRFLGIAFRVLFDQACDDYGEEGGEKLYLSIHRDLGKAYS